MMIVLRKFSETIFIPIKIRINTTSKHANRNLLISILNLSEFAGVETRAGRC